MQKFFLRTSIHNVVDTVNLELTFFSLNYLLNDNFFFLLINM